MSDMVNTFLLSKKGALQRKISLNLSVSDILYIVFCYLMTGCMAFSDKTPFALSAYAACFLPDRWLMFFVSAVLGLIRFRMDMSIFVYIIPLFAATLFMGFLKCSLKLRAFCISGFLFVSSVCANIISGFFWYDCFLSAVEALICFAGVYVFSYAVPLIINAHERNCIYDTEVISLFVLVSLLVKFTTRFPMILGMDISVVLSVLILFLINLEGDISLGAAMGIVFGMVTMGTTDSATGSIGAFALASFSSGILKRYGKWGVVAGFILAHTVMIAFFAGEILPFDIFEIIFASLIFAILPKRFTKYVSSFGAKTVHVATEPFISEDKLQKVIAQKLSNMAESYSALGGAYTKCFETKSMTKGHVIRMIDTVASKVCPDCGLKYNCWERGYKQSYKAMAELLEKAEEKGEIMPEDFPKEIADKCTKLEPLSRAFNRMIDIYKTEKIWNTKLDEARHLVSLQMQSVANSILDLSKEVGMFLDIPAEKELSVRLDSLGIGVVDVTFLNGEDMGFLCEIKFNKWEISKKNEKNITDIIEEITGQKTDSYGVRHEKNKAVLTLGPKNNFDISVGKASVCKNGEKISGDSILVCQNKFGEHICAISDGMGSGEAASASSSLAISLLGNFITSGMDTVTSMELINSAFLLGSASERLTTMDVCSINLNSGKIRFLKTGASAGYIKDSKTVYKMENSCMASNLLQGKIEIDEEIFTVGDSALVVMVSDGVYDVFNTGDKDLLKQLLEDTDFSNPQITASKIINTAMEISGSEAKDDMTAIAINIWKD